MNGLEHELQAWLDERDWPRINRNLDRVLWACYGPILMLMAFESGWLLVR